MIRTVIGVGCVVTLLGAVGCKNSEACEESRLKLAKTWQEVKDTASSVKFPRGEEADSMDTGAKEERAKVWSTLEERAALLESAFVSEQVTWDSADEARTELNAQYKTKASATKGGLADGFPSLLERANKEYEQFKNSCQ